MSKSDSLLLVLLGFDALCVHVANYWNSCGRVSNRVAIPDSQYRGPPFTDNNYCPSLVCCVMIFSQERIKGTKKASSIHTLFHRKFVSSYV